MKQIALIVIYNHPHERNIPIIEAIYRKRFSNIYHLMPFYQGNQANVIPVYASSKLFHNYLPQALPCFFNDKYDHYFFVADDLLLNPRLNENNLVEYLQLDDDTCFTSRIVDFTCNPDEWFHTLNTLTFHRRQSFMDTAAELPSMQEAKDAFQRFGYTTRYLPVITELLNCRFGHWIPQWDKIRTKLLRRLFFTRFRYLLFEYPLVRGYADIFTINAKLIKQFCHLCGIFAAANLFVETAVPTALVLYAKRLVFPENLNMLTVPFWNDNSAYAALMGLVSGNRYTTVPFWNDNSANTAAQRKQISAMIEILSKGENDLELLVDNFPEKTLFIHPVKLSKFDTSRFL